MRNTVRDTARPAAEGVAVRGGASSVADRLAGQRQAGRPLFETGYGPSAACRISAPSARWPGLHLGTATPSAALTGLPSRLLAFSDDMDGLRKRAGQRARPRPAAGRLYRPAVDPRARPVRHPRQLWRAQQRPPARVPRSASASTTSSPPRTDYYIWRAGSMRRCGGSLERHEAVVAAVLPTLGPGARRLPTRRSCRSTPAPDGRHAGAYRARPTPDGGHGGLARPPGAANAVVRDPGDGRGLPSCNGRPTGRCAGTRWAWTTKCPART